MKIEHIKHIFFDLDHTLWDFDKNSALTFDKIFKLHNISVAIEDFVSVYEPINLEYWKLYRNAQIEQNDLRYRRLRDSFDGLKHAIDDEIIHLLSEDYIAHLTTFDHLFEGAIDILDYLKPNYTLHIITNGFAEAQTKKLSISNIAHYFETVTDADMAGVKKPNPIIFEHALNVSEAEASESLMIGDNLEADVLGALEVGYDAIFFNYRNDSCEPHIKQIQTLHELKNYL